MKRQIVNQLENDVIEIVAKNNKKDEIKKYYSGFGWRLIEERIDRKNNYLNHMTFIRNHIVPQKDKLILMQIRLENKLNEVGKIERLKEQKIMILMIIFSILGSLLFSFAIFLFSKSKLLLSLIAFILSFCSIMLFFLGYKLTEFKRIKYDKKYEKTIRYLSLEIEQLYNNAKNILGESYEKTTQ